MTEVKKEIIGSVVKYIEELELLCVISSKVFIYDKNYNLVKKFSKIKYPARIAFNPNENLLYVSCELNCISIISLDSMELVGKLIVLKEMRKKEFEIQEILYHDGKIYMTGFSLGSQHLLYYDLNSKKTIFIINDELRDGENHLLTDFIAADDTGVYFLGEWLNECEYMKNDGDLFGNTLRKGVSINGEIFFYGVYNESKDDFINTATKKHFLNFLRTHRKSFECAYYINSHIYVFTLDGYFYIKTDNGNTINTGIKRKMLSSYKVKWIEKHHCIVFSDGYLGNGNIEIVFYDDNDCKVHSYNGYIDCEIIGNDLLLLRERDDDSLNNQSVVVTIP